MFALIEANLNTNKRGLKSHQAALLNGTPLLYHCVLQATKQQEADLFSGIAVLCHTQESAQVKILLRGLNYSLVEYDFPDLNDTAYRQQACKWHTSGWQGALSGIYPFANYIDGQRIFHACEQLQQEALIVLYGECPLIPTDIIKQLYAAWPKARSKQGFLFCTAPPGLNPVIITQKKAKSLSDSKQWLDDELRYTVDAPPFHIANQACCWSLPIAISSLPYRFLADSQRSLRFLNALCGAIPETQWHEIDAIAQAAKKIPITPPTPGNHDIEIEITGQSQVHDLLYPEGQTSRNKPHMTLDAFINIVKDLSKNDDDICLTLGGLGDPLLHPNLIEIIEAAKAHGIWAISLSTNGQALDDSIIQDLIHSPLDVLHVRLDATKESTYQALKNNASLKAVTQQLLSFIQASKALPKTTHAPILVPQLTKIHENLNQLHDFFDFWQAHCKNALIAPIIHFPNYTQHKNPLPLGRNNTSAPMLILEDHQC